MYKSKKGLRYILSRLKKKHMQFGTILYQYIKNNKREYCIVTILFFIGLLIGVLAVNYANPTTIDEMNAYYTELIQSIKNTESISYLSLLKDSIISNVKIILILWLSATTIIGIPAVYGTLTFKGFSIGYTISSMIACLGTGKGIVFSIAALFLHNMILIPSIWGACVSGIKLYQSIMKNKHRENIKAEIVRHTFFCAFILMTLILSSIVEVYGSTNIFFFLSKK